MFCANCGCRIPTRAAQCPECRADVPKMEYCSGFWLELNQNSLSNTEAGKYEELKETKDAAEAASVAVERNKRSPLLKRALIAEAAIIAILLLYSTISGAALKNTIKEKDDNNAELQNQNKALKEECADLDNKYTELEKEYNLVKGDYDSLKEEDWEIGEDEYRSRIDDLRKKYDQLYEKYIKLQEENNHLQEELEGSRQKKPERIVQ